MPASCLLRAGCVQIAQLAAQFIDFQKYFAAALEREIEDLRRAFGCEPTRLVYGITDDPERPLGVERVPAGELL